MESQWTSKYAILRDLSFAQGRKVPAAIVGSVGVGQKPPAINIKEDTEEEFFQNCVEDGGGDVCTKPDLSLIKQMINLVEEGDGDHDVVSDTDNVVEISKLNPLSDEFVPKGVGNGSVNKETSDHVSNDQNNGIRIEPNGNQINKKIERKTPKKRRQRNAALMSLLEKEQDPLTLTSLRNDSMSPNTERASELINKTTSNTDSQEVKLLKPNHFITETKITEAVTKVNEWLQKPVEPQIEKSNTLNVSPKNMFKKKASATLSLENTSMFKRKSDSSSIKSSDSDIVQLTVPRDSVNMFVPSTQANENYKKYVERRQVQEMAQEDIWKRAERLMKEIEEKRLMEKKKKIEDSLDMDIELNLALGEDISSDKPSPDLPINIPGLVKPSVRLAVLLPQHRHDLPEECQVCLAFAKYQRGQDNAQRSQ